jgi:hypothetical protein
MAETLYITGPIQHSLHEVRGDDLGMTGSEPVVAWLASVLAGTPYSLAAIRALLPQLPRLFGPHYEVIDYTDTGPAPLPQIARLVPESIAAGGADVTLHVTGRSFTPRSQIVFNGGPEVTTFVSTRELTTTVVGATAPTPGRYPVLVQTAAPGGGLSAGRWFYVLSPDDVTVKRSDDATIWEVPA